MQIFQRHSSSIQRFPKPIINENGLLIGLQRPSQVSPEGGRVAQCQPGVRIVRLPGYRILIKLCRRIVGLHLHHEIALQFYGKATLCTVLRALLFVLIFTADMFFLIQSKPAVFYLPRLLFSQK